MRINIVNGKYVVAVLSTGQSMIAKLIQSQGDYVWEDPMLIGVSNGQQLTFGPLLGFCSGPHVLEKEEIEKHNFMCVRTPPDDLISHYEGVLRRISAASKGIVMPDGVLSGAPN
jgi:hypothetical protein